MSHFPDQYRWVELSTDGVTYGHGAFARRDDTLEIHITLHDWNSAVRRDLSDTLEQFKEEARRTGVKRIMGVRCCSEGSFDPKLFRFADMYGFTDHMVIQTASMQLD